MLHLVQLIALRPIRGDYDWPPKTRNVDAGQRFSVNNIEAEDLQSRGLAERYYSGSTALHPPPPAVLQPPPGVKSITEILAAIRERQTKMQPPVENKMLDVEANKKVPPKKKRKPPKRAKSAKAGKATPRAVTPRI